MSMTEAPRIALVDDSASDQLIFGDMLTSAWPKALVEDFSNAEDFLAAIDRADFDCILLDHNLPGDSGLELLQVLRRNERYRHTPIIMLTGWGNEAVAVTAMKKGATDYLSKRSVDEASFKRVIHAAFEEAWREQQHQMQLTRLKSQARTDALTGLLNRAAFQDYLGQFKEGAADSAGFAVLNIDLNKFKYVNDHFGHAAGDEVLVTVARRLQAQVRSGDHVFRMGGDEFVVLLTPPPPAEELSTTAERLYEELKKPVCDREGAQVYQGGGSVGVACYPQSARTIDLVLEAADQAMYRAKQSSLGVVIQGL